MSECADMTTLLAKELTLGIKNEVADIADVLKKMAILKSMDDTAAKFVAQEPESTYEVAVLEVKQIEPLSQISLEPLVFSSPSRSRKKTTESVHEGQLSLFDILAA